MFRPRISIALIMMLVVTAASASALFAQVVRHLPGMKAGTPAYDRDVVATFIAGLTLTGVALAARKGHSPVQAMLQVTLTCLNLLTLIAVAETRAIRPIIFWYQASFALVVVAPLVARRIAKTRLERGPRRDWWMKTGEAIAFSFLNALLVLAGLGIQLLVGFSVAQYFKF